MDEPSEKKSKIEEIQSALYSRNSGGLFSKKRHELSTRPEEGSVPSAWAEEPERSEGGPHIPFTKILIGAFIFFIIAVGFAFYKFFGGSNTVSGNNINILVSGPVSVSGGEVFPLDIKVENDNSAALSNVSMLVEYPDGTRDPNDSSVAMPRYSETIGDIGVGKNIDRIVKASIYGQENTPEVVKITVQYQIAGSNAIFNKEKDYNLVISSSPINIAVAGDSEVNANQQTNFAVTVTSNSLSTVKSMILKVDYPFGFNFTSATPAPSSLDDSVFAVGDLAPGASKTIDIAGSIDGQDGEQRVLKFTVGTPTPDNTAVNTPFAVYSMDVSIKKPSVGLTLSINGNSDSPVAIDPGAKTNAIITWQNNLPEQIYNMTVKVEFTGLVLDKQSVNADNGFYNSSDNSITFDRSDVPALDTVNPGDQGNMTFDFATLLPSLNPSIPFAGSQIRVDTTVSGTPAGGDNSVQTLYSGTKILKLSSGLDLLARGFRTVGPFENSGPFPPKVDNQTTYTITLTATNSFNNVSNAQVTTTLPSNVTWTGFTSPASEQIHYDQTSGNIVWNIGNMPANTGVNSEPREVSFQVAVTPSITQVGSTITLLNETTITGTDMYSGESMTATDPAITTDITSDPAYQGGIGVVTQ